MENVLSTISKHLQVTNQHKVCHGRYATLQTDEDRVKYTLHLLHEQNLPPVLPQPASKSMDISKTFHDKANKFFTETQGPCLDESIDLYTRSIVFAPSKSSELAMSYANRSAVLFKARMYRDCMKDIARALALPYPDNVKAKLYARRARCLLTAKNPTKGHQREVNNALKMAAENLEKMSPQNPARRLVEKVLKEPESVTVAESEFVKWRGDEHLPTLGEENPEIKGVSSALSLAYNKEFGKHIVATRDINPGEVLGIMKPYVAVRSPEKWFTHCGYCLEQCWSSIACEGCCDVVYCNEACRLRAYREHHDVECAVVGTLIALEMSNLGLLSLRLVVRAIKEAGGIKELREKVKEIDSRSDPRTNGFTNGRFDDRDYASVYTLVTNTDKRSVPDLFGRSLNAVYILYVVATRTTLFGKKFEGGLDELLKDPDVTFIGSLIMRHQQMIPSNVHSLTEEGFTSDPIERAAACMPFYSLINHSCNPAVTRGTHGMNIVLYADLTIKQGEQVFDNYGMHYALEPKAYRQHKLKQQFRFTCKCIACTENWPTYMHIPSFESSDVPDQMKQRLRNIMRNFGKYYQEATFGQISSSIAMSDLNNMTKALQRTAPMPCRELNDVVETKKRILALKGSRLQKLN